MDRELPPWEYLRSDPEPLTRNGGSRAPVQWVGAVRMLCHEHNAQYGSGLGVPVR